MEIGEANVWQIAAGDTDRSYADLCLRWGVVLFGPGYRGEWPNCVDSLKNEGWSARKVDAIRKYHEDIKLGDIVVLRMGTSTVYGVGRVESPVAWYDDFGDIDGWDIQFARRVRWLWKAESGEPMRFETGSLKMGDTVQELRRFGTVYEWLLETPEQPTEVPVLPASCRPSGRIPRIEVAAVAEYLFDLGIAAGAINELTESMLSLQQIASWYERSGTNPSESETVAYLAVPLLRTLGWTPQRMAVEWGNIDIALFDGLPRNDESLAAVVEVKKLGRSCLSAMRQGAGYALGSGRKRCSRLVVTDGIRYGIYVKDGNGSFPNTPAAYMNLNRMVRCYPVLGCEGTPKALSLLTADWRTE